MALGRCRCGWADIDFSPFFFNYDRGWNLCDMRTAIMSDVTALESSLNKALRTGDLNAVENALSAIQTHQNASLRAVINEHRTRAEETALHHVLTHHSKPLPIIEYLLQHGADANARSLRTFSAALHEAARVDAARCAERLIAHGAVIDARKRGDYTPLMIASAGGNESVVRVLLRNGANISARNRLQECALHLAARCNDVRVMQLLLASGADVDAVSRNGRSAMHYAAAVGNVEGVNVLLSGGATCAMRDRGGMTAAHVAAEKGLLDVFASVLDGEAVWEGDVGGLTVLHHAVISGMTSAVAGVLKEISDRPFEWQMQFKEKRDLRNRTAAQLALERGCMEMHHFILSGCT